MKAERWRGSNQSNSYILYYEKIMCIALVFFIVLLYHKLYELRT